MDSGNENKKRKERNGFTINNENGKESLDCSKSKRLFLEDNSQNIQGFTNPFKQLKEGKIQRNQIDAK